MKIWLSAAFVPTERLPDLAVAAEEAGFHGLAFADHICTPAEIASQYPYTADRKATIPVGAEFADPLVVSAALGMVTTRLRLAPHVLVVPARHPVLLAKQVATIQRLIGGRLDLGVGAGWMREEFDAVDVPFDERGSRLEESLQVMRLLWSGELVEFHGDHYSFAPLSVNPTPPARVTLVGGGHTAAALRRAATYCDAWAAIGPPLDELEQLIERLHGLRASLGVDGRPFEIRSGVKGRLTPARIKGTAQLGVDAVFVGQWQIVADAASMYDVPFERLIGELPRVVDLVRSSL